MKSSDLRSMAQRFNEHVMNNMRKDRETIERRWKELEVIEEKKDG